MNEKELLNLIDQAAKDKRNRLDLSDKRLKFLPPEIGKLKNLTKLYLSNNQLTTLPPEIGNLKNLNYLDLESNPIENLPSEVIQLKQLNLSLSHKEAVLNYHFYYSLNSRPEGKELPNHYAK